MNCGKPTRSFEASFRQGIAEGDFVGGIEFSSKASGCLTEFHDDLEFWAKDVKSNYECLNNQLMQKIPPKIKSVLGEDYCVDVSISMRVLTSETC